MFYRVLWGWNKTKDVKCFAYYLVYIKDSSCYQKMLSKVMFTEESQQCHCEEKDLQHSHPLVIKLSEQGCPGHQVLLTIVRLDKTRFGSKCLMTDVLKGTTLTWSSQEQVLLGSLHSSIPHVLNILIKTLPVGTKYLGNFLRKVMGVWVAIPSPINPSVLKNKEKDAIDILGSSWCGHQSRK